jgi:hypothetical protein
MQKIDRARGYDAMLIRHPGKHGDMLSIWRVKAFKDPFKLGQSYRSSPPHCHPLRCYRQPPPIFPLGAEHHHPKE